MPSIVKQKKEWFDYPDDPMEGKVMVRHLKDGEVQTIISDSSSTTVISSEDGETIREATTSGLLLKLIVASVVDWKNFNDEDGKPLRCSKKNKERFCLEDGFVQFIAACREKLQAEFNKEKESAEKN